MDADLIRLILLLLGISLVVGIWLWDRRQRNVDQAPMAYREADDEALEEEAEDEAVPSPDQSDTAPAEPRVVAAPEHVSEPEAVPVLQEEPALTQPTVSEAMASTAADQAVLDTEPESPAQERKPAWVEPAEPVIPAFLLGGDSEPLFESPAPASEQAASATVPPVMPEAAEPDLESELAWMPDSVAPTDFTLPVHEEPEVASGAPSALTPVDTDSEPELPVLELEAEPIHAPAKPRRKKARTGGDEELPAKEKPSALSIRVEEDQFDLDLGFSAVDEQDLQEVAADLPQLIVQINVVARRGQLFTGEQILAAMDQVEMRPGEHDIFHRHDNRKGKDKVLFSLASMVEPGSFPLKKMADFSTPGMTLFTQLPGPRDGLLVYSDMLYVAERLARLLDARLMDENRSTLTKQTIEHTRSRIAEHKRQITLKLREASQQHTRGRR